MTLSVVEFERWDPASIREVVHAAASRGNIAVSGLGAQHRVATKAVLAARPEGSR
ncbi:hypothetical protein [Mycobacterium sp. SA01]|uniref:hypothetical protein n=1 Tax=Mycobacterium sp. SA01 TaxID=3238820 RepID=UPI00351B1008